MCSCESEDPPADEWVEVYPVCPNDSLKTVLDSIFYIKRGGARIYPEQGFIQLMYPEIESKVFMINSKEEFLTLGFIAEVPDINFSNYTLVCAIIVTSSVSNIVEEVTLYENNAQQAYKSQPTVFNPINAFFGRGFFSYWHLYPKLNADYTLIQEVHDIIESDS